MLSTRKRIAGMLMGALAAVASFVQVPIRYREPDIDPQLKRVDSSTTNRLSQKKRRQRAKWVRK